MEIRSRLRADRALLKAEIVNEGEIEDDPRVAEMLEGIVAELAERGDGPVQKKNLAEALGVKPTDRTFERALEKGLDDRRLKRPKHGKYGLRTGEDE